MSTKSKCSSTPIPTAASIQKYYPSQVKFRQHKQGLSNLSSIYLASHRNNSRLMVSHLKNITQLFNVAPSHIKNQIKGHDARPPKLCDEAGQLGTVN